MNQGGNTSKFVPVQFVLYRDFIYKESDINENVKGFHCL